MKTPIAYYGGKQNLANTITHLIPEHEIYIEPFCGGAAILFAKPKSKTEILNDTNDNIMNFYKIMRRPKTAAALQRLINEALHCEATHQKTKDIWINPAKHTPISRAFATWYQCNFSFAKKPGDSFARSNEFGNRTTNKIKTFNESINRLKNVTLYNTDAITALNKHNTMQTFAYIDPPYINTECAHYNDYTELQYTTLLDFLTIQYKGKFILSTYKTETLTKYTQQNNWNKTEIKQNVSIDRNRNSNNIKSKTETLTYNFTPPQSKLF